MYNHGEVQAVIKEEVRGNQVVAFLLNRLIMPDAEWNLGLYPPDNLRSTIGRDHR